MLHLFRLTSLLLKVSCTCSALWNSLFKTQEWLLKVSLYCVSFQKVCVAGAGLNVWHHQSGSSLCCRGFLGKSCSSALLTLRPSVLLPDFTPPQINSYWQESRSALQKESQSMKWPGPYSLGSSPAWNLSHSLISWCAVLLMAGELCPCSQNSTLFSRSAAVILIYRGGSQAAFFHDSGFIVWTTVFFLVS